MVLNEDKKERCVSAGLRRKEEFDELFFDKENERIKSLLRLESGWLGDGNAWGAGT